MESLVRSFQNAYAGRRVFLTGHTGFKGAWMAEWLLNLGAEVCGFSLPPPTEPALFDQLNLASRLRHITGDVRDLPALQKAVADFAPDYVFHLAAQPLVRYSYQAPVETFAANVLGTAHLLDAVRTLSQPCAVVIITTDKCYENIDTGRPFEESDRLGGHDPYSASKAAAEIVTASYRQSFFAQPDSPVALASARAGNVIGGGDWALDRIVPDAMRALAKDEPIPVRNRHATRPFQHVLDPLAGYLTLGAALRDRPETRSAFNFGPHPDATVSVEKLVTEVLKHWPGTWRDATQPGAVHEAKLLHLSIEKAHRELQWQPVWGFETAIQKTVEWYRHAHSAEADIPAFTRAQISQFSEAASTILPG